MEPNTTQFRCTYDVNVTYIKIGLKIEGYIATGLQVALQVTFYRLSNGSIEHINTKIKKNIKY